MLTLVPLFVCVLSYLCIYLRVDVITDLDGVVFVFWTLFNCVIKIIIITTIIIIIQIYKKNNMLYC